MKYLFLDTETNGLPVNYKAPYTDTDNWPIPVSIAWVLYEDNECKHSAYHIIDQEVEELNPSAQAIHGITREAMREEGMNPELVYDLFLHAVQDCDLLIGHNLPNFDLNIVLADLCRNGKDGRFTGLNKPLFCTMKSTTAICKLPSTRGGYKWPKLEELYYWCFGRDFPGAHNALSDVQATAECFFYLKEKNLITLP